VVVIVDVVRMHSPFRSARNPVRRLEGWGWKGGECDSILEARQITRCRGQRGVRGVRWSCMRGGLPR
jgi:hypothetical protein